ncbi:hypothetical protein [Capnocytophaga sp.]|uniref:hypothetical protein n=1 Tax=Capnocytophaga sp. TaxID=44737 RepID=UPI0026DCD85E|nr:hypothetical protein [Capnocytophaga sp.]MDO5106371.1 hypothetical protein [Capnocytophaga sp.]
MKKIILFLLLLPLLACNKRAVMLPQVSGSNLQKEITDYSTIYIFFDEQTRQAQLNRNNLITSTHWVFNVDKRLSLFEVGKQLVDLQEKKNSPSLHKNPDSRNFFSVADMTEQQLKLLEFTKTQFALTPKGSKSVQKGLSADELKMFSAAATLAIETVSISGAVSFQDFIVFLQAIQEKGIFLKQIHIN